MRSMDNEQRKEIEMLVYKIMTDTTSSDYTRYILEHIKKQRTFMDDAIADVMCASARHDEGYYNNDDIRLAIGRVLMERLNIQA